MKAIASMFLFAILLFSGCAEETKTTGSKNSAVDCQLIDAAVEGDYDGAKTAIESGANVNAAEERGIRYRRHWTVLIYAVDSGNIKLVKLLVDKGADVNLGVQTNATGASDGSLSIYDNTPLFFAVMDGNENITAYLISKGANPNVTGECRGAILGTTPLEVAVFEERYDLVSMLIDAGADVNAEDGSALRSAAEKGNNEIIVLLIENGADVNAETEYCWTPLDFAMYAEKNETVELLRDKYNAKYHVVEEPEYDPIGALVGLVFPPEDSTRWINFCDDPYAN